MSRFLTHEFLNLSEKVDYIMSCIEDLKAAEADLTAVVEHAILTVGQMAERLNTPAVDEAAVADVANRLRVLRGVLVHTFGEPAPMVPVEAPVVQQAMPVPEEVLSSPPPIESYTSPGAINPPV